MATKIVSFIGLEEIENYKVLLRQLFAEFSGTLLYMTIVLHAASTVKDGAEILITAIANGLVIATVIQIFGFVSGAHINPAVTAGLLICGHIKLLRALCYVAMQILGGVAGSAVTYYTSVKEIRGNMKLFDPYKDARANQIFTLEFLMTFLLVATVLSVIDQRRGARGLGSSSLTIGLCVTGCLSSSLPYTGTLNPVRVLGPGLLMNQWRYHWVLWSAPMLGGIAAGLVYRLILSHDVEYELPERTREP